MKDGYTLDDAFEDFVYLVYGTRPEEYCSKVEELRVAFKAGVKYAEQYEVIKENDGERK